MAGKEMTLVYYYVPQDRDDPDNPNVFGVSQSKNNLKLGHIHQSFPLKGSYIFRFKYNNDGSPVWLDLPQVTSKIPLYKDRIIMKATRVSWNQSKLHSQYKDKQNIQQKIQDKPNITTKVSATTEKVDFFNSEAINTTPQPSNKNSPEFIQQQSSSQSNHTNDFSLLDDHHNGTANTPKKEEVNMMQGFDKHGDLI